MPGVTFTQKSAKRIADAVHKIEEMPQGQQNRQRRRAGGLGRSTLWEVTAVQTGAGTVTIKRVSNIDFDLNDPSEKEDILYDPDNEPSEGDRGLLIRLGNGNLFFFRQTPLDLMMTAYAYVSDEFPDSTFGYPSTLIAEDFHDAGASPSDIVRIGFAKFANVARDDYSAIVFPNTYAVASAGFIYPDTVLPEAIYTSKVWKITDEDFAENDFIENITYNQWAGLEKTPVARSGIYVRPTVGHTLTTPPGFIAAIIGQTAGSAFGADDILYGFQTPWEGVHQPDAIDLDGAYGVAIEIVRLALRGNSNDGLFHSMTIGNQIGYATKKGL